MDGDRIVKAAREALRAFPEGRALRFEGQWISWRTLETAAARIDDVLERAGAGPTAPVALVVRNRPSGYAALLGLLAEKRPIAMVYSFQSASAIGRDIRELRPAAVIAEDHDWNPELTAAASEMGCCGVSLDGNLGRAMAVPGLERISGIAAEGRLDPQIVLLTSGTTGLPKRFPTSYDVLARSMLGESMMVPQAGTKGVPSALLYYSLGNISGIYGFIPTIAQQRTALLLEKFTLDGWVGFVRDYRPPSVTIPTAGVRMVLDAQVPREDLASLEFIWSGAAPLDTEVHRAFEKAYGVPILMGYGATEFAGAATSMTLEDRRRFGQAKLASVGRPWGNNRVRIVSPETGEPLAPDAIGLLEVCAQAVGPDWIRTQDLGRLDPDGFLYHCGRADGAINRGGFKIVPVVVEQALMAHPAVAAAAVVGLPDARLGEAPVAAVELRPGVPRPQIRELEQHLRQRLPATHVPLAFLIVESLPRTESMKISTLEVRRLFLEGGEGG